MAYSSPDLSICITRYTTDDACHFGSKRIEIVPNGIPDESGYAVARKGSVPPKILFLSTVSKEKGVGVLLAALITLRDRGIAFRCKIVGRPINKREDEEIRSTIRDQGLSEVVVWQEELQTSQKTEIYSNADIFCFPTHYHAESFGLVSVEAMMFALPVVATAWRGLREIVVEGETGFLVPVKAPALLAGRLQELIERPEMRKRMGEAGRRRFLENYTVEKFRDRMEEVLVSV
jgi:glycosyltransferase involved in cell wall biosynthesis